jgi:beta-lactamase regulating signal transducer with metallopeptidase domain
MGFEWSSPVFSILGEVSLRAVILVAIVAAILWVTHIRSSVVRHRVWSASVFSMILMPLLLWILPAVRVPFPAGAFFGKVLSSDGASGVSAVLKGSGYRVADSFRESVPELPATPNSRRAFGWASIVLLVYASGVALFLLRQGIGWLAVSRLMRSAIPVRLQEMDILESNVLSTALIAGAFRPRILLPAGWQKWSPDNLRAVLIHENAHIDRRDSVVGFFARLNCAIFWFHPIAWWLERKVAVTAEQACDEAVVRQTGDAARYAAVLVEIAEAVQRRHGRVRWEGIGIEGTGALRRRIERLMTGDVLHTVPAGRKTVVAILCAGTIYLAAACRPETVPTTPVPTDQPQKTTAGVDAPAASEKSAGFRADVPQCRAEPGRAAELLQGEVDAGKSFSQTTPSGWVLRLVPITPGWALQITTQNRPEEDLSRVTSVADSSSNSRMIEGWHFQNANAPSAMREFIFSPRVRANTDYSAVSAETVATIRDFGRGWLYVSHYELRSDQEGKSVSLERIRFSSCLTWPASEGIPTFNEEDKAIARVRYLDVHDLDPVLNHKEFRYWFDFGSPVNYELNDCGETRPNQADLDVPLCVEARTSTRDGTNFSVSIYVGSLRSGVVTATPSFSSARIERGGRMQIVDYPRPMSEAMVLLQSASALPPSLRPQAAAALDIVQATSLDTDFLGPDTHPGLGVSLARLERAARAVSDHGGKNPEDATKAFHQALNNAADVAISISTREVETAEARAKARELANRLKSLSED